MRFEGKRSFSRRAILRSLASNAALGSVFVAAQASTAVGAEAGEGQFRDALARFYAERPTDFVFAEIPVGGFDMPSVGADIVPDESYVELYLESCRLSAARRLFTRYAGVAYAFVSLEREASDPARIASVSRPDRLAELDASSSDRIITVSKQMMGPIAFRGGPIDLQFGLFSIRSADLLTPVLDYVVKVSETAGVTAVNAVKPFLPLISEGMALVSGQIADAALEVGLDVSLTPSRSTLYAIIAAPREEVDPAKLTVDAERRLLLDGRPMLSGYALFSLRSGARKHDYARIPELRDRYAAINVAIRRGSPTEVADALAAFRFSALASPDLITSDAQRLVDKVQEKIRIAFPPRETGGPGPPGLREGIGAFAEIGLYD